MTGIDHREGGLANFAFSQSPDYIELNGDGIHVNESCLKLCSRLISENSLILISDAVIGAGLPYGDFSYYGRRVVSSKRGVRYADSDVLMGSNMLGIDIVKNYCFEAEVPLWRAVRAMSLVPRKALGLDKEYGSIEVGKMADIFLWDKDLETAVRPKALLASENGFKKDDLLGNRFQVRRLQKKD
jgi:N-acetylglucosamine-6-phosphate deacetylase